MSKTDSSNPTPQAPRNERPRTMVDLGTLHPAPVCLGEVEERLQQLRGDLDNLAHAGHRALSECIGTTTEAGSMWRDLDRMHDHLFSLMAMQLLETEAIVRQWREHLHDRGIIDRLGGLVDFEAQVVKQLEREIAERQAQIAELQDGGNGESAQAQARL